MLMLRASQVLARQRLTQVGATASRGIATSVARKGGFPPFLHLPPPPPTELEPDGTPKKYPLHQPIYDHGYHWEQWHILPAGVFHTVYWGDFAQDFPPYWAWLQQFPFWVVSPFLIVWALSVMVVVQNSGSIGIKPKRYTIEWMQATRERERQENTNPVTRYLDRRRTERGGTWIAQYHLPWHPYWMWMSGSHDEDFPEYYAPGTVHPHLHWKDDVSVSTLREE